MPASSCICSANTFSTPSATNTFPCPPPRRVSTSRPSRHSCRSAIAPNTQRERELTFRPGTAIIVVTRFFVCPRNSTSPPPLPIFFLLLPPCFRVARAVQIRLSRCDVPIRYPGEIVPRRWMRMSDGKKILSIDAATSWQFWNILIDWIISKFYSFFSRTNEFRFLEISSLPLVRVNISKRYIHLYSFRG